jgi:hypothetical protein
MSGDNSVNQTPLRQTIEKEREIAEKRQRLEKANQLIQCIAFTGRRYFNHFGKVSFFELDQSGVLWFVDSVSQFRVNPQNDNQWKRLNLGKIALDVALALTEYISDGTLLKGSHLGPYISYYYNHTSRRFSVTEQCNGDPWAYGDDMAIVQNKATELGVYVWDGKKVMYGRKFSED